VPPGWLTEHQSHWIEPRAFLSAGPADALHSHSTHRLLKIGCHRSRPVSTHLQLNIENAPS
jgi:hypothetical protein